MDRTEKIEPNESEIVGNWTKVEGRIEADFACRRIELLTSRYLKKIGTDVSGWETLFQDPEDGRYWERTYPHGDWHGGGPPTLTALSESEVRNKSGPLFE